MFIPWPALLLTGVLILTLIVLVLRRPSSRQDMLMGSRSDDLDRPPAPPPRAAPVDRSARTLSKEATTKVRTLLANGHKIDAIKLVREETGLGLRESKELAESLER